jgi:DNA-binding Lrp family transcriptional regulator
MAMDTKDKKLLALLQANAREPTSSIARKLEVSRSTVQSRIKRLEERGVIGGYTVRLNEEYDRARIRAHVLITVAPKLAPRVDAELQKLPEVTSLYSISGVNDLIAIVAAETTSQMDGIIDAIGRINGIERTTTSIVLSTKFER